MRWTIVFFLVLLAGSLTASYFLWPRPASGLAADRAASPASASAASPLPAVVPTPASASGATSPGSPVPRSAASRGGSPARQAAEATFHAALDAFAHDRDADAAATALERAIAQDPTFAQPRYDLAIIEESRDNWDQALTQLQKVLELENSSSLGVLAAKEKAKVKDIQVLWDTPDGRKKVEYDRGLTRSRALLAAGAIDDAVAEASDAIRLDPTRFEAHAVIADALNKQGSYAAAAAHVRQAMELAPADLQPRLQQALAEVQANAAFAAEVKTGDDALSARDYGGAGDHYLAAWKMQPSRETTGLRAAMMLALADRLDDARGIVEKLVSSTDPRICREAAEQLKTIQTFQHQQQLSRDAEASVNHMRQQAGLPPLDSSASASPPAQTAASPAPANSTPHDSVTDLINGAPGPGASNASNAGDSQQGAAAGASPAPAATQPAGSSKDSVLDLINSSN